MNFEELRTLTGVEPRRIRYLIQLGVVPRPGGSRKFPEYGDEHVQALRRYIDLHDGGLTASGVAKAYGGAPIRLQPSPGVDITIAPDRLPSNFDESAFLTAFAQHMSHFLEEKEDADDRHHG